jgi:hypothetical protein
VFRSRWQLVAGKSAGTRVQAFGPFTIDNATAQSLWGADATQ